MTSPVLRYSAFTTDPSGGNPAGVWIGEQFPDDAEMQRIATEVGYSETAFLAPEDGATRTVRYFTPEVEVPFCGHATIASGVVLGETAGTGRYTFMTPAGEVTVDVQQVGEHLEAALTSVEPRQAVLSDSLLEELLAALGWDTDDLDATLPPMRAFAGIWHAVLAVNDADRLATLDPDNDTLGEVMSRERVDTLQLIWRETPKLYHSRNLCPGVGVPEDPATGSAAAALGGYLRDQGLVAAPSTIVIRQGEAMGRPSRITVEIPEAGGIVVRGTAVPIE
jgi:PhzF family phenazine biosynthesis protein